MKTKTRNGKVPRQGNPNPKPRKYKVKVQDPEKDRKLSEHKIRFKRLPKKIKKYTRNETPITLC